MENLENFPCSQEFCKISWSTMECLKIWKRLAVLQVLQKQHLATVKMLPWILSGFHWPLVANGWCLQQSGGLSPAVTRYDTTITTNSLIWELGSSFANGNKWLLKKPLRCSKSSSLQLHTSKPSQLSIPLLFYCGQNNQALISDKLLFCLHNRSFTSLASHDGCTGAGTVARVLWRWKAPNGCDPKKHKWHIPINSPA